MKWRNVIVKLLLIFLMNFECSGSTKKSNGHLKCILGLHQPDNSCPSSHFIEFLDVGEDQSSGSSKPTAQDSSSSSDISSADSVIKIYVLEYFDAIDNNDHVTFLESHNFTWSLACYEDFRRMESYHAQIYGIPINSLMMSGSMPHFFETFNMTLDRTMADFCESLKAIKCKFIIQPQISNESITHWGGVAQSAFDFVVNGFLYLGAARTFCR
ncbi:unnamed protein product [Allacma fusca]|uniref:Uncharacterized protein n=1 Tax=Allacma fusca TaxID=39272 RepID=A0A8J2PYG9_9HEXA|nr:unnamed protein product [Allacma fusca]